MSEYSIYLKEVWEKSKFGSGLESHWTWSVSNAEGYNVANGVVTYGGDVGEKQARKDAEQAATLDAKRESAKVSTYEFTPEI